MTVLDATSTPNSPIAFAKPSSIARALAKTLAMAKATVNRFWAYTNKQEKADLSSYNGLI